MHRPRHARPRRAPRTTALLGVASLVAATLPVGVLLSAPASAALHAPQAYTQANRGSVQDGFLPGDATRACRALLGASAFGVKLDAAPALGEHSFSEGSFSVLLTGLDGQRTFTFRQASTGLGAVIVKGAANAASDTNVYRYDPAVTADESDASGVLGLSAAQAGQQISHVSFCYVPVAAPSGLVVATQATSREHVATSWTLSKTVSPEVLHGWAGGSAGTATWEVVAERTDTSTWAVTGEATVTNPTAQPAAFTLDVVLDDEDATRPTLDCGAASDTPVAAAGGTVRCTFSAVTTTAPGSSTAVATSLAAGVDGGEATGPMVAGAATASGSTQLAVSDSREAVGAPEGDTVSASTTWTYPEAFSCPVPSATDDYVAGKLPRTVRNTATGTEGVAPASADLVVDCSAPVVVGDPAIATWERTHAWGLRKEVDTAAWSLAPGQSGTSTYTVTATRDTTEGGYTVAGRVDVTNPSEQDVTVAVSVDLPVPSCDEALLVPAGQTASCDYESPVAARVDGTVTATVRLGALSITDQTDYVFAPEPTTTSGSPSVTVRDVFDGRTARELTADREGENALTYSEKFTCSRTPADYTDGTYRTTTPNTAVVAGTVLTASRSVTTDCVAPWKAETATPEGPRWPKTSNWFMYTAASASPVALLAGQTHRAGTITMTPSAAAGMTDITVVFANNHRLRNGLSNNVKVHPMATVPGTYLQPGAYSHKSTRSGSAITVTVPARAWYGIHLDVERAVF